MDTKYSKKVVGTSVFALVVATLVFGVMGFVQAAAGGNGNGVGQAKKAENGHVYGGQPQTPPPGQVGNTHSNRAGTPGNGRGK